MRKYITIFTGLIFVAITWIAFAPAGVNLPHSLRQLLIQEIRGGTDPFTAVQTFNSGVSNGQASVITVAASNTPSSLRDSAHYKADGTNDEVEIQAAISSLSPANDGGKIVLLPGVYTIGATINLRGAMELVGSGIDATTLTLANGVNDSMFTFPPGNNDLWLVMRSMELRGNKANNSSGHGIVVESGTTGNLYPFDILFQNLYINNFAESGISSYNSWGHRIFNVISEFNEADGIHYSIANSLKISGSKLILNDGRGLFVGSGDRVLAINNEFGGGVDMPAVEMGAADATFTNNFFHNAGSGSTQPFLWLKSNDYSIVNNSFQGASAVTAAVRVDQDPGVIVGNVFRSITDTPIQSTFTVFTNESIFKNNTNFNRETVHTRDPAGVTTVVLADLSHSTYALGASGATNPFQLPPWNRGLQYTFVKVSAADMSISGNTSTEDSIADLTVGQNYVNLDDNAYTASVTLRAVLQTSGVSKWVIISEKGSGWKGNGS